MKVTIELGPGRAIRVSCPEKPDWQFMIKDGDWLPDERKIEFWSPHKMGITFHPDAEITVVRKEQ
jgi:hypothetical protein